MKAATSTVCGSTPAHFDGPAGSDFVAAAGSKPVCTSPVLDYLQYLHREFAGVTDGKVATYIPELAKANPSWFGISLVTATGQVYEAGDSRVPFTIQSISKPFVYGLALEDNARQHVLTKVSTEPTGEAFNSISLEPGTGRPRNPMINAGAIATTSLVEGRTPHVRLRRLLEMFGLYAGRELSLDEAVYHSESQTGHRNRAIGHMLRNFDILTSDPMPAVELYFQQCSVSVTARDLAVMAATLANRGVNPVTGKQAIRGEYVESVLSVMASCGMYDYAGEWLYHIGMPAKSGVAGGVIAVLPGQLGIGVFSPPLDSRGNSVRGIRVCDAISRHCDLHLFNRPSVGPSTVRLKFTAADFSSHRIRSPEENRALQQLGERIKIYQLQGHLTFPTAEVVVRDVVQEMESLDYLVLDLKRVLSINESSCRLFYELLNKASGCGKHVLFTHADRFPLMRQFMKAKLGRRYPELFRSMDDNDLALEWCESHLLMNKLAPANTEQTAIREHFQLFENFSQQELALITPLLHRSTYHAGEVIVKAGDLASEMFFLARGNVSVYVPLQSGRRKRLATFSAGMVFGEMALIDRAPRSATIIADTETECDLLKLEDFDRLGISQPAIKIKLLENLSLVLSQRLRKANRELSLFD